MVLKNALMRNEFFRYCFCGGISALVDLSVFYLVNEILQINYLISTAVSFTIANVINYNLQKRITFKNAKSRRFLLFTVVQISGLLLNGLIMYLLVEFGEIWPTLARIAAILIALVYNYQLNRTITFRI